MQLRSPCYEPQRRCREPPLLGRVDGQCGRREAGASTAANFDEHEIATVAHYEIDFAVSAADVASERGESAARQPLLGQRFGRAA